MKYLNIISASITIISIIVLLFVVAFLMGSAFAVMGILLFDSLGSASMVVYTIAAIGIIAGTVYHLNNSLA